MQTLLVFAVLHVCIELTKPAVLDGICGPNTNFTNWQHISPPPDKYTLIQSNIYIRHGDRTQVRPIQCFNDIQPIWYCDQTMDTNPSHNKPSKKSFKYQIKSINASNVLPGTCLLGQLTSTGYNQCFSIGQSIKQRYSNHYHLLPKSIHKNKHIPIYLRSDTYTRVQLSVMAFFDGLYKNNGEITVPLFTADEDFDIIKPSQNVCPYLKTMKNANNSDLYQQHYNNVTLPLLHKFKSFMGYTMRMLDVDISTVFDCGNVWSCSNISVPNKYTQQLFNEIINVASWNAWHNANYPNYINATKYNIGPLLKLIFSQLYSGMMCDMYHISRCMGNNYKLYVYGGHENGIIPILGALGVDMRIISEKWIPYAAFISFELFKNNENNKYYVLMSYNGKLLSPLMCNCNDNKYNLCEWNKFENFMLTVTPKQYECPGMKNIPQFEDLVEKFNNYNQSKETIVYFITTFNSTITYTHIYDLDNIYKEEINVDNNNKFFQNKFYIIPGITFMFILFIMMVVTGICYSKQQTPNIRYELPIDSS